MCGLLGALWSCRPMGKSKSRAKMDYISPVDPRLLTAPHLAKASSEYVAGGTGELKSSADRQQGAPQDLLVNTGARHGFIDDAMRFQPETWLYCYRCRYTLCRAHHYAVHAFASPVPHRPSWGQGQLRAWHAAAGNTTCHKKTANNGNRKRRNRHIWGPMLSQDCLDNTSTIPHIYTTST